MGKTKTTYGTPDWQGKAIILLDLDAFFASVEQLDHPEWRGKPVIVGGDASKRGVVSTCSYEARKFGVRSAMPASQAARLCPHAIWASSNFARYKEMLAKVMSIMLDESPFLQQVSIDEAFLDITPSAYNPESPVSIAQRIQKRVCDLGITCSIGLGTSKSIAKVASDMDKPRGLTVVFPGREAAFLQDLPIARMSGIGSVAQKRLHDFGISTMGQVVTAEDSILKTVFGKNAQMMRDRCRGIDAEVDPEYEPAKSVSNEISFAEDISSEEDLEAAIGTVCAKVARRLRKAELKAGTITLKIRFGNFETHTHACRLEASSDNEYLFTRTLLSVLPEIWKKGTPVRLVGMAATRLGDGEEAVQESLFRTEEHEAEKRASEKRAGLSAATDIVRDRFGEGAVSFGREMRTRQNLTGSGSKNPADYKPLR